MRAGDRVGIVAAANNLEQRLFERLLGRFVGLFDAFDRQRLRRALVVTTTSATATRANIVNKAKITSSKTPRRE